MSDVFFTSDAHFGHANIIRFCERPFADLDAMHSALAANWNKKVGKNDKVYCLGDMLNRTGSNKRAAEWAEFLASLHGRKWLVRGNHDKNNDIINAQYEEVADYLKFIYNDQLTFILFHYPIQSWDKGHRGSIHLHGHIHSKVACPGPYRRVDVGMDAWNYEPAGLDEILALARAREGLEPKGWGHKQGARQPKKTSENILHDAFDPDGDDGAAGMPLSVGMGPMDAPGHRVSAAPNPDPPPERHFP